MRNRIIEIVVGFFILSAFLGLIFLAFRVSDFGNFSNGGYYDVKAEFDNVGSLKVRAPVAVAGVKIGEITGIALDPNTFRAVVTMRIEKKYNDLPIDTSANIFTQGILGSNYISLTPGFEQGSLRNNSKIETTHSALILEDLIGQLIYSFKPDKSKDKADEENKK